MNTRTLTEIIAKKRGPFLRQVIEILSLFTTFFIIQIPFLLAFNVFKKNKLLTNIRFIAITSYVVVIINLTLWPPVTGQPSISWSEIPYNIKPFDSILGSLNHFYYLVGIRNILGNFVLILPLAFFIKLRSSTRVFFIGFCISLSIEFIQVILTKSGLIFTRAFDVDDLILNTFGFFIGYLLKTSIRIINRRMLFKVGNDIS